MSAFTLIVYVNNMNCFKLEFKDVIDYHWDPNRIFLNIIQSNGNRTQIKGSNIDMIIEVGINCK